MSEKLVPVFFISFLSVKSPLIFIMGSEIKKLDIFPKNFFWESLKALFEKYFAKNVQIGVENAHL